jgi:hypothetical protein
MNYFYAENFSCDHQTLYITTKAICYVAAERVAVFL